MTIDAAGIGEAVRGAIVDAHLALPVGRCERQRSCRQDVYGLTARHFHIHARPLSAANDNTSYVADGTSAYFLLGAVAGGVLADVECLVGGGDRLVMNGGGRVRGYEGKSDDGNRLARGPITGDGEGKRGKE